MRGAGRAHAGLGREVARPGDPLGLVGVEEAVLPTVRREGEPQQAAFVVGQPRDDVPQRYHPVGQVGEAELAVGPQVDGPDATDLVGDVEPAVDSGGECACGGCHQAGGDGFEPDGERALRDGSLDRVIEAASGVGGGRGGCERQDGRAGRGQ